MTLTDFWTIIEKAHADSAHNEVIKHASLVSQLECTEPEEIIRFEILLRELIIKAVDYNVLAAQKIIEGRVTDDTFLYFRCWLISQGQYVYTETLHNPDYLADYVLPGANTDFEMFLYVSTEAFESKTGKNEDEDELDFPRYIAWSQGLNYDS